MTSLRRHRLADRGNDCYETPPEAVQALLRVEQIPDVVWEPACGPGAIVEELRATGRTVIATDLADYSCPDSTSRIDFLMERRAPPGVEAIVSNFPFKLGGQMVEHALTLVPFVIVLCRLTFLESERRSAILDDGPLARVHLFKRRLPMMHRRGWDGPRSTSQVPYAWFVFERGHRGPAQLDRVDWNTGGHDVRGHCLRVRAREMESPARLGQRAGPNIESPQHDRTSFYWGDDQPSTSA
jgi:hypothetical protein